MKVVCDKCGRYYNDTRSETEGISLDVSHTMCSECFCDFYKDFFDKDDLFDSVRNLVSDEVQGKVAWLGERNSSLSSEGKQIHEYVWNKIRDEMRETSEHEGGLGKK